MRRDIVKRTNEGKGVQRHLTCGHVVPEPHGSKAHKAVWANCTQCEPGAETQKRTERMSPPPPTVSTLQKLQQMYKAL